ncbi:MAG: hypothetical protein SFW65_08750 [Alphaproteobacteria bacterium]|nr:hypothetical protein [Alphaproteobacteria bacterium]
MTQSLPLPIIATVKAAYGDVIGNLKAFLGSIWLILLMMVLFVEIPTLIVTQEIYKSIHPEVQIAQQDMGPKLDLPPSEKGVTEKIAEAENSRAVTIAEARQVKAEHLAMILALNLFQVAMVFSFSVAWYRQLLLGEKKDKTIIFHYGKPEWHFTLTAMKSGFAQAPIVLVMVSFFMASIPEFAGGEAVSISDNWPLFIGGIVLMLYLIARTSMSYPITVMGEVTEPFKQSWVMTKQNVWRIFLGNLLIGLPTVIVALGIVIGVSLLISTTQQNVTGEAAQAINRLSFAEHVLFKTIGAAFILFLFGLISAFYARAYAFMIRTKQA